MLDAELRFGGLGAQGKSIRDTLPIREMGDEFALFRPSALRKMIQYLKGLLRILADAGL